MTILRRRVTLWGGQYKVPPHDKRTVYMSSSIRNDRTVPGPQGVSTALCGAKRGPPGMVMVVVRLVYRIHWLVCKPSETFRRIRSFLRSEILPLPMRWIFLSLDTDKAERDSVLYTWQRLPPCGRRRIGRHRWTRRAFAMARRFQPPNFN